MQVHIDNKTFANNVRAIVAKHTFGSGCRLIEAIKEVRSTYGIGLKLSKDLVEAARPVPVSDPVIAVIEAFERGEDFPRPF